MATTYLIDLVEGAEADNYSDDFESADEDEIDEHSSPGMCAAVAIRYYIESLVWV